mgnify:CR=1 FL=1
MNLFEGEVANEMDCQVYGIRPEHLDVSTTNGRWKGEIRHLERLGADTILHMDVPRLEKLIARVPGDMNVKEGMTVYATPIEGREHVFQM